MPYHHGNLREAILERAAEVIAEHGVAALSLRGLARDLDVSHAAPSAHFRDRRALLSALAQEGFQQCLAAVRIASEAAGPDPVARYRALGRAYVQFARDNPSFFRAITHPEVESHADEDLLKARAVWMETLRDGIGAAQAAGWQADIEVNTLLAFSCGATLGMAQMVSDPHWNLVFDDVDALADAVFDLVVHRSRFTAVSSGNKRRKAS